MCAFQIRAPAATYTTNTINTDLTDDSVTINDALISKYLTRSGSGVYVRVFGIQKNNLEMGYNYGGKTPVFDQKTGSFDAHVDLGDVVIKTIDGTNYLEFSLDLNENDDNLILEEFRVYLFDDPSNTANDTYEVDPVVTTEAEVDDGDLGQLIWDLDEVVDNNINMTFPAGSGYADMGVYVPQSLFTSYNLNENLYIWMKYTSNDDGFEEFALDKLNGPSWYDLVPEPSTVWGGAGCAALALVGVVQALRRRRQAKTTCAR